MANPLSGLPWGLLLFKTTLMAEHRVNIQVYRPDGTMIAQYLLGEGEHLIGREYGCPIYLESDYISSQHAKLQLAADGIHIEDLNSTSGTFLDGVTVRGKLRIKPGQVLQVGDLTINLQPESEDQIGPGSRLGGGRYTLVKLLGRGGMGEVWLAQDGQLDEQVALKRLPSEMGNDPVAIADLKREVQKSRLLSHRNIIRIHDLYQQPGEDALVSLEYVDGTDLSALANTKTDRIFTWEEIKPLIVQLCEALDHAHEEKIVHRDLKPANMMMTREGKLKLADFGIAATMADSLSRSSMRDVISGTSLYMSPQQMEGEVPRASDDIYAFGATVYELLTSRQPFYTGDIQHQVLNVIPKPMDQRLAEFGLSNPVPDYVHQLVMSCLAKDEEGRPASAAGIRDWINSEGKAKGVLGKTSTKTMRQARPQPADVAASHQAGEGQRKSKALLIATIAVAAILAIGLGIWFSGKDNDNTGDKKGNASPISKEMQAQLRKGLVAYYPFNGNANDESGNGNDGEEKGVTLTTDRHGNSNSAYSFDGENDYIKIADSNSLDVKHITITSWVKLDPENRVMCLLAKKLEADAGKGSQYAIFLNTETPNPEWGSILFQHRTVSSGAPRLSPQKPRPFNGRGEWSHLVVTLDDKQRVIYINGEKFYAKANVEGGAIIDAPVAFTRGSLRIGKEWDAHPFWFSGSIDDLRIYNRALSVDEIEALYNLEKSGVKPNSLKAKAAIEAAIRKAAGKPRGKLTRVDLEKVTRLELPAMQLTDASALAGLTKLRLLKVNNNNLSNDQLKHVARLASLEWLDISHNRLTDVSALMELTNLKRLYLDGNKLTDVSPLIKLTQLEGLYLASNQLTDVSALAGLAKLDKLDLRSNRNLTRGVYQKLQKALPKLKIYVGAAKRP